MASLILGKALPLTHSVKTCRNVITDSSSLMPVVNCRCKLLVMVSLTTKEVWSRACEWWVGAAVGEEREGGKSLKKKVKLQIRWRWLLPYEAG